MSDLVGIDLLINGGSGDSGDSGLPNLESIDLPTVNFDEAPAPAPRIVPTLDSVGPTQTWEGVQNLNAEPFLPSGGGGRRMNEELVMKEKQEILRKFERLSRLGVPMRKKFTMDSPLEEMKMELEFIKKEKSMDQTIQQFSEWFVTGMGGMEWASKNVPLVQAFGLKLDGLSEAAQMKVGDMEEDFEELQELQGDKIKMHPLVRIPIRTCMMVYMVHLTNQMVAKAPVPNIDQVLRSNPDIARQLATAAMQQQQTNLKQQMTAPPPPSNPLAGIASQMGSMMPPPPPPSAMKPTTIKSPVRLPKPQPPPPPPVREMKGPEIPSDINALLEKVNSSVESKSVKLATPKKGGSTGKHSVSIKL